MSNDSSAHNLTHLSAYLTNEGTYVNEEIDFFVQEALEHYKINHEGRKLELFILFYTMEKAMQGLIHPELKQEIHNLLVTKAMKKHLIKEGYMEVASLYNPKAE